MIGGLRDDFVPHAMLTTSFDFEFARPKIAKIVSVRSHRETVKAPNTMTFCCCFFCFLPALNCPVGADGREHWVSYEHARANE